MKKPLRKRGRPPVERWVISLIGNRVLVELGKAEDKRLQAKELAYEIHKEISMRPALKRPPALNTLEKKVQETIRVLSENSDLLDEPWTVQSMNIPDCSIPAEALPSVLQVWFFAQQWDHPFTIREARWAARLYAAITNTEPLYAQCKQCALQERLATKVLKIRNFMGSQTGNLLVHSVMTGHEITREELVRLSGQSEDEYRRFEEMVDTLVMPSLYAKMDEMRPRLIRFVDFGTHYDGKEFKRFMEKELKKEEPGQKEARNERKYRKKRQE